MDVEKRIKAIEFRMGLLYNNSELDRYLYECEITEKEYHSIMNIMDEFRSRIDNNIDVDHCEFEQAIYNAVPNKNSDYHFCELIAKLFAEEGRWEEVFEKLYGDMPKYN